ncbi:YkgB family protein [Pseudomonas sp. R76]|uniref:YkgB family protein n=1 Tax=Pseudomonas sp. R76 TaxID=1573711 RepID=UPI00131FE3F6|nr:DUF417 family protein [Pseudomonas sp. R76]QHD08037.1 hypothetical protein PspR76_20960 [Pseudomonas sp. R76]
MNALNHRCFTQGNFEYAFMRWSLVLIFFLFGYSKWFAYEANALIPIISNSPLMSWMHPAFGIQGASYFLGTAEWMIGIGLALGAWMPRVSVAASMGSVLTYLTTLTLIITTPDGWEASAGGFPAMGGATSFLVKDIVLLAGSIILLKQGLVANCNRAATAAS